MIGTGSSDFDKLAGAYDEYRVGYSRALYDQMGELGFRKGWNVLDVACGTAIASVPLSQRGMHVTGVDRSEEMLARARLRLPDATFVKGHAEALPFADNEFAGAVCAQAIHWFDQTKALAEMLRVVKPGGRVAVWWKKLIVDEPIRALREEAAATLGLEPVEDIMRTPFSAFYEADFKERWLRVIPYTITSDADKWLGYERSRRRARNAYGEKTEDYLVELERIVRERANEKPFQVRYTQYLYVGEAP